MIKTDVELISVINFRKSNAGLGSEVSLALNLDLCSPLFLDQQEDQGMTQTFIDEQHHELSRHVQELLEEDGTVKLENKAKVSYTV